MLWCDFKSKLRKLHPLLKIHSVAVPHSHCPDLMTLGIYFDKSHVAGVTYDDIPRDDILNEEGVMTHQGLRSILKQILEGTQRYAENKSEYWKMGKKFVPIKYPITPSMVRKVFRIDLPEIYR